MKKGRLKKAVTKLALDEANAGKLASLDRLAGVYISVVQRYADVLISSGQSERRAAPSDPYAEIPWVGEAAVLSERWKRCAWQQACGLVRSWFSNGRTNRPVLGAIAIQANANVVKLEKSETGAFDYWLRISTLEKGKPVRVPIRLYTHARRSVARWEKLCSGVTLNRVDGRWYATLVLERGVKKKPARFVRGIDIGVTATVATSDGERKGQFSPRLRARVEKANAKRARKQKLNACLKAKGLPEVSLRDHKAEAFARNQINRALNQLVQEWPEGAAAAKERLSVADMRMKSREMNRLLRASQLGFVQRRLEYKLDEAGIVYRSVQPAYSSQQCSRCGFTFKLNRRSQAEFVCLFCHHKANADENAARNIAERFGDDELNRLFFRDVETVLARRFLLRLPRLPGMRRDDARSASCGLDAESVCTRPGGCNHSAHSTRRL